MELPVRKYILSVLILAGGAAAWMPGSLRACNVPAFRYALERWPADPYQVLVYYRAGAPGPALELLQKGAAEKNGGANYVLRDVDIETPEGKALAAEHNVVAYPWVEVYYPLHSQIRAPVWSGPLTLDRARKILNSPGRSRLAKTLLNGEVAVWVLIRSGHEQKDRRALEILRSSLERAAATLRIPDVGADLNGNPIAVTDFKSYPVRFSMMEIALDDPDEDVLVSALLKSEPDVARYGEPVAFPVFGRGRALYALVGAGIQEKNIREACQSMLAWCSCEIKSQNPGTDLLIAADWARPFGGRMVKDPELPLTGIGSFLPERKTAESSVPRRDPVAARPVAGNNATVAAVGGALPASNSERPSRPAANPLTRNLLYLAGASGVALVILSVFLAAKAKR